MKRLILLMFLLVIVMLGCDKYDNSSEIEVTMVEENEVILKPHVTDGYISEEVLGWLGEDDLHPLVVSIFPKGSDTCPVNFHEWDLGVGVACAQFLEDFEYRIDDLINGRMLDSSVETVQ